MEEIEQIFVNWKQHRPTWNYELHNNYAVLSSIDDKKYETLDFMERSGVYWLIPELKKTKAFKPILVASEQNIGLVLPPNYKKDFYKQKILAYCPHSRIKKVGNVFLLEGIQPKEALMQIKKIFAEY